MVSPGTETIYFESKIQYYVVSIVFFLLTSILYATDWGGFADLIDSLVWISLTAFIFVGLYPASSISINSKGLNYKKGWRSLSVEWTDIEGIHANPAPSLYALAFHAGKQTSFLIETTKGNTGYIDGATIKVKGKYSPFVSSGEELMRELTSNSKVNLTVGTYSEFRDAKDKNVNRLIAVVLLMVIAISFYYVARL